jgi:hypothetical protein
VGESFDELIVIAKKMNTEYFRSGLENATGIPVQTLTANPPVVPAKKPTTYVCTLDPVTGEMVCACERWYYGESCDKFCPCNVDGTQSCNDGIAGDGSCTCKDHWVDATCSSCDNYFYGEMCQYFCHPDITETELKAMEMVNMKETYACSGHGDCIIATDDRNGVTYPYGCTCDSVWQGKKHLHIAFGADEDACTANMALEQQKWSWNSTDMVDANGNGRDLNGVGHDLCVSDATKIAKSDYSLGSRNQIRCYEACTCNELGTNRCENDWKTEIPQGTCHCNERFQGGNCTTCVAGLYGANCDVQCTRETKCKGRGECNVRGQCVCEDGFFGVNCERLACPECNMKGACVAGPACDCAADYTGHNCEWHVLWRPQQWGKCEYNDDLGICGSGLQSRDVLVRKILQSNELTPVQIAEGYVMKDEWFVELDPDFKPKTLDIANNERAPTFEPSPGSKQNCFHPLRVSCDCGAPPAWLVENARMANCSALTDGEKCDVLCKKKYQPIGQFECFKGAYKDPLPKCLRLDAKFSEVAALAQTINFEVKQWVDSGKWMNATEEALPRTISFFTTITLDDIVVHKVSVVGRRRLGDGQTLDFDEETASAFADREDGEGDVVRGRLAIDAPWEPIPWDPVAASSDRLMLNKRQRMLQARRAQSPYANVNTVNTSSEEYARQLQAGVFKQIVVDYAVKVRDTSEMARIKAKLARVAADPTNFEKAFMNALINGPYRIDAMMEMI